MSNRTLEQVDLRAKLRASHLSQMDALLAPGLSRMERIDRFVRAAEFDDWQATEMVRRAEDEWKDASAAYVVWTMGSPKLSLFAYLLRCGCPVQENFYGGSRHFYGIPSHIATGWEPTRETLEAFARVQIEERCGL